jgi:hypothetical protein
VGPTAGLDRCGKITFEERRAKCFPRVAAGQRKMDHQQNSVAASELTST